MSEFNNRIDAQRVILSLVNGKRWNEELYGLSKGAIDRWIRVNGIDPSAELACTVFESAEKLFFLANKSQEQVTDEYRLLSVEVSKLTQRIGNIVDGTKL
ncbi:MULTISPECIES: hypothetical protein [Burkholderia]|uniref:hypothetical protein n=1 Tax=Burkholderia TaxID=32008 RepID=UPI00075EC115|nr:MULTISPECIES: hypothetical protein [Burkholderia]KWD66690.1 hypothetical protein WL68_11920 [Burkholderia cepacia]KWD72318.1 hypothetical protein WL69_34195 [Burkholderia cepacia]MBR8307602.1 hypothetical protein [Burkholderia cenocepacia]UVE54511.1 hypothetical protein KU887_02190 [Burkholderia sp. EMB26]